MGRRTRGRGAFRPNDNEELLGLSGWVYSDLLLGVAVVFLAAVSFQAVIPVLADGGEAGEQSAEEGGLEGLEEPVRECLAGIALEHIEITLPRGLQGPELVERAMASISAEIDRQFDTDVADVTFGFMLAFGGATDPNRGIAYARATSEALIELIPERFERVVARSYWGGRGNDEVRIDLFPYITEPCDDD